MKLMKIFCCILSLLLLIPFAATAATIPALPEGGVPLVSNGWRFNYDDPDVFSIKNDKVYAALMGYNAYGAFDLSYYDLKEKDTYVIAMDLTINEKFDSYSGPRINFRGSEDGKAYQIAIQSDCVYMLDVDLRTGLFQCIYSNTEFCYELNTTYRVEIVSSASTFSVMIDGKEIYSAGTLAESRPPMFGLGSGVGVWNVANYTMYNASSKTAAVTVKPTGDATNAPTTTTTTVVTTTTAAGGDAAPNGNGGTSATQSTSAPDGDGNATLVIVLVVCGIVLIGAGVFVVLKLGKKKNKGPQ